MQDSSKPRASGRRIRAAAALFGLSLSSTLVYDVFLTPPAEAHHGHHRRHYAATPHFSHRHHRHVIAQSDAPQGRIAAIVVDANSGRTLYARQENDLRHPASITKVMTLYLLFEQLEQGRLGLDSELRISQHAAAQAPTKLGLRPGATISVDDAIKAVVTRSANDIAVAIAEAIGGDEDNFAEMMTRKAHALGMSRTYFVNASGLPDDAQVTTAHDLAILGRAIQDRYPRYYHYFATHAFYYAGQTIVNHNHLLDRVEGMDGIKTGYTRSSGFNLLTSVRRDGRHIVAVVLGGASAASRDRVMARLIEDEIDDGATARTAALLTEGGAAERAAEAAQAESPRWPEPLAPEPLAEVKPAEKTNVSPTPKPIEVDPVRVASISPDVPIEKPRPAFVPGAVKSQLPEARAPGREGSVKQAALDGSTARAERRSSDLSAGSTATPSSMRPAAGSASAKAPGEIGAESLKLAESRPAAARSGWMIQIGATDDVKKATELLARAKSGGCKMLSRAQPFTEKVEKGSEVLYRARFAGLEAETAELACKSLKRSGFSCFATKN